LSDLIDQGTTSILITIVEAKGSVPRGAGTKMIVTERGIHYGTIGGGNLEYQSIRMAQQRLLMEDTIGAAEIGQANSFDSDEHWLRKIHRFPLGASLGQCCGGMVIVLFECIEAVQQEWLTSLLKYKTEGITAELLTSLNDPQQAKRVTTRQSLDLHSETTDILETQNSDYFRETVAAIDFNIVVFGAGHVGRALVHVLSGVECELTWVDSRVDEFPEVIPVNVTRVVEPNPEDAVDLAPVGSYFIVLTHSHNLDQLLCEKIIARGDFRFCGLIGSKSKRMKFEHRLKAKGFSTEQIATLTCPIGASGLTGKQPGHIAVAVAAQLLALQESQI
jgi:xanthine dehydrogenase accessory factor